jgi:hypothetical protein
MELLGILRGLKEYRVEVRDTDLLAHRSQAFVLGIDVYLLKSDGSQITIEETKKLVEEKGEFLRSYPAEW